MEIKLMNDKVRFALGKFFSAIQDHVIKYYLYELLSEHLKPKFIHVCLLGRLILSD